jgi:hypothetical protein
VLKCGGGRPATRRRVQLAGSGEIVDVAPAELEADRRPLAHRYFGPELGDAYVASTDEEGNLKFSMRSMRWWPVDYTKLS